MYMEIVMILDEPGLEDLVLLAPCSKIECSGLGFEAFTILPIEAVGVAGSGGRWFISAESWNIRRCYCRQIGKIGSV
jgi:hypothetical protein